VLHVLLSIIVIESATNESLACVQGIFRVLYGLDIIFKNKKEKVGGSESNEHYFGKEELEKCLPVASQHHQPNGYHHQLWRQRKG